MIVKHVVQSTGIVFEDYFVSAGRALIRKPNTDTSILYYLVDGSLTGHNYVQIGTVTGANDNIRVDSGRYLLIIKCAVFSGIPFELFVGFRSY